MHMFSTQYVEQSWSWWWPFSWPWWGGEKSPSDPVDTPSDESPLADIDLYEEPPKDNDVDDVYPPEDDGDEIPDEPIDVVPPKPDCEYGEWQDVGPCKGKCGEKGTQKRLKHESGRVPSAMAQISTESTLKDFSTQPSSNIAGTSIIRCVC
eukprot:1394324-Amorphochlora_amoeboformis.AAC.2